jgi:hypothetical protein
MAHTGSATGAYDDLQFEDQLRYVGPDEPEMIEFVVTRARDARAVGEADDGRKVTAPLTRSGDNQVRARGTDRDEGAFRQTLGYMRDVEVLE